MSFIANKTENWLAQYSELANNSIGAKIDWLSQQRSAAIAQFEKVGLPNIKDEDWRYTPLRTLKNKDYLLSSLTALPKLPDIKLATVEHPRLVFVNGFFQAELSNTKKLADGLLFTNLAAVLESKSDLLETVFGSTLPTQKHGFTELNTAFCQDGFVIKTEKNCVVKTPVEIVFISSSANCADAQTVSHSRNFIISGASSELSVIERHINLNDDDTYLNNSVTEIIADQNSQIDHYKIQLESPAAYHIGGVFITQARDSRVTNHNVALGGLITRNDINVQLLGEGAHAEMNGLVLSKNKQHIDNHTEVTHAVPNCTSDEYYKMVLDDSSRAVFRGRIIVAEDAQKTDAQQQNNNLLLSGDAEVDTKPQLEIYADDVKCSHGCTVGQLDPKSMFYLQSRGIDAASAKALLTFAFANEVVGRIKVDFLHDEISHLLAGQLVANLQEIL